MTDNKYAIVTIITASHYPYAAVLYDSLCLNIDFPFDFYVLVVDGDIKHKVHSSIKIIEPVDLGKGSHIQGLHSRYYTADKLDEYRWSLKAPAVRFLLESYEAVLYCDSDLCFFSDASFLFQNLEEEDFLLTPHWFTQCLLNQPDYANNMHHGLYNAGFFGAAQGSEPILDWWAEQCLLECRRSAKEGFFLDQGYLNLIPIRFDGVRVLKHRGLNVAGWNRAENVRSKKNEEVLINDEYPVVFIHFNPHTVACTRNGNDPFLFRYLSIYASGLRAFGIDLMVREKVSLLQRVIGNLRKILKC
ncbi:MAG: hypothetical protein V7711_01315 [Pseudomonadales bacterium]